MTIAPISNDRRRLPLFCLLLIFACSAVFYFWLIGGGAWSDAPSGFYGWQTEAFLKGQLHLTLKPHPMLAELANPYLGDQNRDFRVLDLSYHDGKYYSYFGVGPLIGLTLPWRLVTRTYLTEPGAVALLAVVLSALSLAVLLRLRRDFYPHLSLWVLVGAYNVTALGNYSAVLLIGQNAGAVAQMGAYCALLAAFLFLLRAPRSPTPGQAIALASFCCGAAVACRPSFLPALGMIAPFALHAWRTRRGSFVQLMAAWALPFAFVLVGLLFYNYARFGSVLEFGNRLQLTDVDFRQAHLLSWSYLRDHFRPFLFQPQAFSHYFPFVANQYDRYAVGLFWAAPVFALSFGLLLSARNWLDPHRLASLVEVGMGIAFAGLFLFLAAYQLFLFHYEIDFFVPGMFVAILGWFALLETFAVRPQLVRWLHGAGHSLCLLTVGLCLLHTFASADFEAKLPRVTRTANAMVERWDRLRGITHGPIRMTVIFSPAALGQTLPLVLTGSPKGDLCYATIDQQGNLRVGFFHTGAGGPLSDPVPITPGQPYEMEIQMGSLLPEIRHPFFDGYAPDEIQRAKSIFRVKLDGKTIFASQAVFYPSSPGAVWFGENPGLGDVAASRFAGKITRIEHLGFPDNWSAIYNPIRTGAASVRFRLPSGERSAGTDPLLSTGSSGKGDAVFVRYLPQSRIQFGLDHWGSGMLLSEPMPAGYGREHRLIITSNSLAAEGHPVDRFELRFDGKLFLSQLRRTHPSEIAQIHWGINAIGSSVCGGMFTGTLLAVSEETPAPPSAEPDPLRVSESGVLTFTLQLHAHGLGQNQPLICSGVTGKADLLYVKVLDSQRLSFGLDHWGVGDVQSEPIAVDISQPHRVLIEYGPVFASFDQDAVRAKNYRISIDGVPGFTGHTEFYPTKPEQIFIGRNPIGASTASEHLIGTITDFKIVQP